MTSDNGFDWSQFQNFFQRQSPPGAKAFTEDLSWVEQMVRTSVDQAMKAVPQLIRQEVFETHRHVIIKLQVPKRGVLDEWRLLLNDYHLLVKMAHGKEERITFPVAVVPSTARARYKDGILQIQVRKRRTSGGYREISATY